MSLQLEGLLHFHLNDIALGMWGTYTTFSLSIHVVCWGIESGWKENCFLNLVLNIVSMDPLSPDEQGKKGL